MFENLIKGSQAHRSNVYWIFFALNAKPTSMRRALAERLAEDEPVIVVDRLLSVLRDHRALPLKERCNRLPGVKGPWNYQRLHFPERLPGMSGILRQLNRRQLQCDLNQLLPQIARRIVCYDSPTQDNLVGKLREDVSIYLAIDDRTITTWGEPISGELEAEVRLLSKVDRVVCVSETLAEVLISRVPNGRTLPIHVLQNGYNERLFDPNLDRYEPESLRRIPRPRILVAGHISERIDWEGVKGAVKARPEWTWVFVGPADNGMKEKINALGGSNFYHPPVPVEQIPTWIKHCNACAVPYRLNPFTMASSPLKAVEYLAMDAPVLSTRIPSLECYDGAIEWVKEGDGESYAKALDEIANQAGKQEIRQLRRRVVSRDSWGGRVKQFREIVFDAIT
jgi:glycosyltransferase involved in cell wall biosynthesis